MKNQTVNNIVSLSAFRSICMAFIFGLALTQNVVAQQQIKALLIDPENGQAVFSNPELATQALTVAIADSNIKMLHQLFGDDAERLLPFKRIDQAKIDTFVKHYANSHRFLSEGPRQYVLEIGEDGWIFPVPIALGNNGWYFDSEEGVERIRIRRIGKNELAVMQASLAYYDAQLEYAEQDRDGDGVLEYAQKFLSNEGEQNGLYWETPLESQPSPLGPLFSMEAPDETYFGYRYQILTAQGEHASGGKLNYLDGDNMSNGFALLAWPAVYGDTGVMTFMVNQEGLVFSSDLGTETAELAKTIRSYNPGTNWQPEVYVLP